MKRMIWIATVLVVTGVFGVATAQQQRSPRDRGQGPPERGDRGERSMQRPDHGPPPSPVMTVLDTDQDGELSAEEIANAAKALLTLDRDGDGMLSREEMKPPRGRELVEHVMSFDADGDGKVTFEELEELPERLQRRLARADTDADGAISRSEAEAMAEEMEQRRPSQRGGRERGQAGRRTRP